ncbi:helix-turn-helix domain-containing protein [Dactylosporangium roseum]|uniref:Helix-turn-helix domain-containing protein n=1 Tax=Dactylosporangium roseum TaxID=47989 RepID=A0ABY5ZAQ2_9ACTN|nr:hypothetical protein [Dactylosporangium roseum]UWZ37454.1 helix-turn-helix domain-containing protein [Dactylosporangium roseum]
MVNADAAGLERRLNAGEWLTPGEAAKLLGVSRSKMHLMLVKGQIRTVNKPASRHRTCNPADVRRELNALRQAKAAQEEPGEGQSAR